MLPSARIAASLLAGLVLLAWAAPSALSAPVVGAVGPDVLVRPTDTPVTSPQIQLVAAGGEFESAQVVVRAPGAAITGLDVSVTGSLTAAGGAAIPASNIRVFREGYVDLEGFPSDGELGGALGRFPDPLIPTTDAVWGEHRSAFPIDVPTGENRVAWIDVLVPSGAMAGTYTGAQVHVRDASGAIADVPLEVDVQDMDVPATSSLDGGFDLNTNQLCAAHSCASYPGGQAGLLAAYERVALDDRLTIAKPPTPTPSGPNDPAYVAYTRPLLLGTAGTQLRGARLKTVTIYQWATESADEWRRAADTDGFVNRVRFHCDEVGTSATLWSNCRRDYTRANALWRGAAASGATVTDLPLEVTTGIDQITWAKQNGFGDVVDKISVLIPVINYVHPKGVTAVTGRRDEYAAWNGGTTAGGAPRSLWSYTSCMSMGCSGAAADNNALWDGWPSYGVDQPPSEGRAMGWVSYLYDLHGEYYYETARNLPTAWTNLWSSDGGNHGDGTLFYPGTPSRIGGTHDTVVESIRLKRIRDGREDYELLLAAERAAGRAATINIAHALFTSAFATNVSQTQLDQARAGLFALADGTAPRVAWPVAPGGGSVDGGTAAGAGSSTGGAARGIRSVSPPAGTSIRTPLGAAPAPSRRTVMCGGFRATIVGTDRNDVLRGTHGRDVIAGLGGNDKIFGFGGGDIICTGSGTDAVQANTGSHRRGDLILCGVGRDTVAYDSRDRLRGTCERRRRH